MKKSKRWKIEDRYYGACNKFDRRFVENYEGTHMPIHRFRDRRNWKGSFVWIPRKYVEGLVIKYLGKSVEALERAYNIRAKDIPNAESFKSAFDNLILNYKRYIWRRDSEFKYIIEDGIIKKNPEYKVYKPRPRLKSWQYNYNFKHVVNPGEVRTQHIESSYWNRANTALKDRRPIYLGKLYVEVDNKIYFVDVYHYYPEFFDKIKNHENDGKLQRKLAIYDKEWVKVKTGITSLDCYKYIPNPRIKEYKQAIESGDLSEDTLEEYKTKLKWARPIIKANFGIGTFLHTVCKRKDLNLAINSRKSES